MNPYKPDAEFTPSSFGGGWLKPFNEAGEALCERVLAQWDSDDPVDWMAPPWPDGWVVEPYEVREMVEWAEVMGVALEGAA
jgi:hypothetical protein